MSLVFAKSGVELLLISIKGDNQFWKWQAWMLVLGLVAFALLQLWYLHKALKLADPTIVCPCKHRFLGFPRTKPFSTSVAFCFYNLSSIVNGLVYFDQVSLLPTSHILLVTVGIFILLGGVWAVSLQAVNVGTWTGGDEVDVDVDVIEDGIVNESALPDSPTLALPAVETPERPRSHTISSESVSLSPPPSPRVSRGPSHHHHHHHHHHHPSQTLSGITIPISPPQGPLSAPGFSIGLSPASPGFALVPRERRRCVSGQSGRGSLDEVFRHMYARRTASESHAVAGDEVEQDDEEGEIREGERDRGSVARTRWRWVRTLVRGH
jgi:magnesium transporter